MADLRDPIRPGDHVVTTCDRCATSLFDSVPYQFADGAILCEDCGEARLTAEKAADSSGPYNELAPTTRPSARPAVAQQEKTTMRAMLTATFDDRTTAESFIIFLRHHDYMTDPTMPTNLVAETYPVYFWLDVRTLQADLRAIAGAWGKGLKKVETPGHVFSFGPVDVRQALADERRAQQKETTMGNDWTQGTIPSGEVAQHVTIYQNGIPMEVFTFPQGLIDMAAARRDRGELPGFSFAPPVWHCAECEYFGENIDAPDHGRKGGESSSEELMEFPLPAFERARLTLDVHTGMTRRNMGAVESRIVDLIADLLLLADRWELPTGRILERANAQAFPIPTPESGRKGGEARSFGVADIRRELRQVRATLSFLQTHENMFTTDELEDLSDAHTCVERVLLGGFDNVPESGRKGGSASSSVAETPSEPDAGIDWSMGMSNCDRRTGIRYGVISQHSLMPEAIHDAMEADYGDPACPECNGPVIDSSEVNHPALWRARTEHGCFDFACLACRKGFDSSWCYSDEPIGHSYSGEGYELVDCLDSDVMVLKSPFYTHAQFCSPCVPGAGNLDSPMPNGVRTFCLPHDWFEEGVAPYPVYRVSDDSEVTAEEGES